MIIVYTTDTCSYCPIVKQFLKLKKQDFEVIDITDDPGKRQELYEKTNAMTVPIIQKGDKYVVGYQPKLLMELINA